MKGYEPAGPQLIPNPQQKGGLTETPDRYLGHSEGANRVAGVLN